VHKQEKRSHLNICIYENTCIGQSGSL